MVGRPKRKDLFFILWACRTIAADFYLMLLLRTFTRVQEIAACFSFPTKDVTEGPQVRLSTPSNAYSE